MTWHPIGSAPKGIVKQSGFLGEGPIVALSDGHTLVLARWQRTFTLRPEFSHLSYTAIEYHMMAPSTRGGSWALVHTGAYAEDCDIDFTPLFWCDPKDILPK